MEEVLRHFLQEQKRRDEEQKRRDEEQKRRDEEHRRELERRDEEHRRELESLTGMVSRLLQSRESLILLHLKRSQVDQILGELDCSWKENQTMDIVVDESLKGHPPFEWKEGVREDAHAPEYLKWLEESFLLNDSDGFFGVGDARKKELSLKTCAGTSMKGFADVVVCTRGALKTSAFSFFVTSGIITFELKKKGTVTMTCRFQALGEHIIASQASRYAMVTVLTDLCDFWEIFWFRKEREILSSIVNRDEARTVLVKLLRDAQKWGASHRASGHDREGDDHYGFPGDEDGGDGTGPKERSGRSWTLGRCRPGPVMHSQGGGGGGDDVVEEETRGRVNDVARLDDLKDMMSEDEYKMSLGLEMLSNFVRLSPAVAALARAASQCETVDPL
jgi:hypothetical protein